MNVILFGATGMLGQGVLRECLQATDVEQVLAVGRRPSGTTHARVRDLVIPTLTDFTPVEPQLTGFDACFFCLGVTSAGLNEVEYRKVTYDIAVAAANTLVRLNPGMTFVFISGAGADSTEQGRTMWARVKGAAENAVLALPFGAAFVLRPAIIQPLHGIRSRTVAYRVLYSLLAPLFPLLRMLVPGYVTTTERIGLAMLNLVRRGYAKRILESGDINVVAAHRSSRHPFQPADRQ